MEIRHVCLVVRDLKLMTNFYRKNFNFNVVSRKTIKGKYPDKLLHLYGTSLTYVKLNAGTILLELIHFNNPEIIAPITFNHIALTVKKLDELYNKLVKQGVHFTSPPIKAPDSNVKVCFCIDPESNRLELVEELK